MIESMAKYIRYFNTMIYKKRESELNDFISDLIGDIQLYQSEHIAIRYTITIDDQLKVHISLWREEYVEAKIKLLEV